MPLVGVMLSIPQTVKSQQPHDLADVLRRAGSYVEEFQSQLAGIVAEDDLGWRAAWHG